eukprot:9291578-Pyramimonas_sp.AAC.1
MLAKSQAQAQAQARTYTVTVTVTVTVTLTVTVAVTLTLTLTLTLALALTLTASERQSGSVSLTQTRARVTNQAASQPAPISDRPRAGSDAPVRGQSRIVIVCSLVWNASACLCERNATTLCSDAVTHTHTHTPYVPKCRRQARIYILRVSY